MKLSWQKPNKQNYKANEEWIYEGVDSRYPRISICFSSRLTPLM
jgi:hypothetical protein